MRWVLAMALLFAGCTDAGGGTDNIVPTGVDGGDSGDVTSDTGDTGAVGGTDTGVETTGDDTGDPGTGDTGTGDPGTGGGTTGDTGTVDGTDDAGTGDPGECTPACDDGNACTKDVCKDGVCVYPASTAPECAPTVTIDFPERGVTYGVASEVIVSGEISSPIGEVLEFQFGDSVLPMGIGPWEVSLVGPDHGINVLSAEVTDAAGQGRAVQSFLMGEGFYETTSGSGADTLVTNGFVAWLGKELWDDDDLQDIDDVATVAHLVLDSLDVMSLIPQPLTPAGNEPSFGWCEWTVYLTEVSYDVYAIDAKPKPGGVLLSGTLTNLVIGFDAQAPDFGCPDAIGTATAAVVTVGAFAYVWLDEDKNPQVLIEEGDVDVELGPLEFDITGGIVSGLDVLFNWFDTHIAGWIESAVEGALIDTIGPMIAGLLESLGTFVTGFEIPPFLGGTSSVPVSIAVAPSYIHLSEDGAVIGLAISATTPKGVGALESPGSIGRNGCFDGDEQPIEIPTNHHVAIAVHDDLLNQAAFAAWWGGILNVTIDSEILSETSLDLPIVDPVVTVAPLLPPVLTSCTPNGKTRLQVGDLEVSASFEFNDAPASVRGFVSAVVEVDLEVAAAEGATIELSFGVTDVIALDLEIIETTGAIEGAKNLLQLLLTNIVEDVVIKKLSEGMFKNFPVPTFDMSTFLPGLPESTVLTFDPNDLARQGGYIILDGNVKE